MFGIPFTQIKDFLEILVIIWGFVSGAIVLWLRGQFVTRKTFDSTVKLLEDRITDNKTGVDDKLHMVQLELTTQSGTLKVLDERTKGIKESSERSNGIIDRIDDYLRVRAA